MTSKKYRPWNPDQAYLFPPSMRDWLEEDHLVYRLLDAVGSLDIRPISHSIHAKDARGARPYNPRMMLALCDRAGLLKLLAAQPALASA